MSNIVTYNNIISVLEDVATRHYQINNFGYGNDWEIGTQTLKYPLLWVKPINATMTRGNNENFATFNVSMNLKVIDLVNKDESNENDVISDTLEILKDIITEFTQHPYYNDSSFNIIDDLTINPLDEVTDEECTGWEVDINMRTPFISSFCGIPVSEIPNYSFPRPTNTGLTITDVQYITDIQNTDSNLEISHTGSVYTINSSGITDLDNNKYDKSGGTISGNVTITGTTQLGNNIAFEDRGNVITTSGVTFDLSLGNIFINTLSGATEMDYSNATIGTYIFEFNGQTTNSALTFASNKFQSPAGVTPTLTATSGATDMITSYFNGSKMVIIPANNITDLI